MTLKEAMTYRGENEETLAKALDTRPLDVRRWCKPGGLLKLNAARLQQLAEALDGACAVPLDIMDACCEASALRPITPKRAVCCCLRRRLCGAVLQGRTSGVGAECRHQHKAHDRPRPCRRAGRKSGPDAGGISAAGRRSLPVRGKPPAGLMQRKGNVYVYHFEGCARRGRHERSKCRPLRRTAGKGVVPTLAVVRWVRAR